MYAQQALPVQSDAIWTGDGTKSFHSRRRCSKNQADPYFHYPDDWFSQKKANMVPVKVLTKLS